MIAHISFHQCPLSVFQIEPFPVSRLCVAFKGAAKVALTWETSDGTTACRILLEDKGSNQEPDQNLTVTITDLKPGFTYKASCASESKETQRDSVAGGHGSGELQDCASRLLAGFAFQ